MLLESYCTPPSVSCNFEVILSGLHEILPNVHRINLIYGCNIEMIGITKVYKVSASVNLCLRSKTLNRQLLNFWSSCDFC